MLLEHTRKQHVYTHLATPDTDSLSNTNDASIAYKNVDVLWIHTPSEANNIFSGTV